MDFSHLRYMLFHLVFYVVYIIFPSVKLSTSCQLPTVSSSPFFYVPSLLFNLLFFFLSPFSTPIISNIFFILQYKYFLICSLFCSFPLLNFSSIHFHYLFLCQIPPFFPSSSSNVSNKRMKNWASHLVSESRICHADSSSCCAYWHCGTYTAGKNTYPPLIPKISSSDHNTRYSSPKWSLLISSPSFDNVYLAGTDLLFFIW